ncbi:DNA polymerase III subunit alpha [bacterium NHP-B]|nr:DNA polymerase III subunit alpha [bacterium NHP-B]
MTQWGEDAGFDGTVPYVPLKNHTNYSLLEGAITVEALIHKAQKEAWPALGMTDTGNMFGAMAFSLAAQKAGIKPVLGSLLPLFIEDFDKQPTGEGLTSSPSPCFLLPLFVQNKTGYEHLSALLTLTSVRQEDRWMGGVHISQLVGRTEGLLAFSGGARGPIPFLYENNPEKAGLLLTKLGQLFKDRFYIEIERTRGQASEESFLLAAAFKEKWPLVATNEAFFAHEDDYAAHDALICVKESTYVNEKERRRETPHHRLKSPTEMASLFADIPEALINTVHVAKRCSFLLETQAPVLPPYPLPEGKSQADLLRAKAEEGLEKRLKTLPPDAAKPDVYQERLNTELDVIISMGFDGYFLIVSDFVQWAKEQGIPVGPGRGSGAGSLVAWCLSITDVDPIRFKLIFERFLNPERVSMPDFDIDFCPERRDDVIAYVQKKYGSDSVAHIVTFGKLQARAVLRDVGRVLSMPYGQVDKLAKRIPFNPANPVTLKEVLAQDAELRDMCAKDGAVGQLFDYAKRLEGLYRHASTHAAGVVIGGQPLVKMLPLYKDPKSSLPATGFSMHFVEKMGLVKFDFLGLKTLTVLQDTVNLANKRGANLHLSTLPLDDDNTFVLLRNVNVVGLFQLESAGMRDVLYQLQPHAFEELIALVALYRPGPMDDIPYYLACRHGREEVTYAYPCLQDILKETFGVMVYQEQVLQIAQRLAGYTLGQADLLRRAMGKKIKKEMEAQRKHFIDGVLSKEGGPAEKAAALFDQIAKFAGYAFVRAHATPYALLSYQTAYMKANHTLEFMAASMNQDIHNTDRLALFAQDMQDNGLTLLGPDINASMADFSLEDTPSGPALRYGLAALKNVGKSAMDELVNARIQHGPFKDIYDVFERLRGTKVLNKRQLESLIAAGALDALGTDRHTLMAHLDTFMSYGALDTAPTLFHQEDTRPVITPKDPYPRSERLRLEYDAIGFYLNDHPITPYTPFLPHVVSSHALKETLANMPHAWLAAVLISSKIKMGRSGKRFAFLHFSDPRGTFEAIMFEDMLASWRERLVAGDLFQVKVSGRTDGDQLRLLVEGLVVRDDFFAAAPTCTIHVHTPTEIEEVAKALQGAALSTGHTSVHVQLPVQNVGGKPVDVTLVVPQKICLTPMVMDRLLANSLSITLGEASLTTSAAAKDTNHYEPTHASL